MTMALPDDLVSFCRTPHRFLLDVASRGPAERFRMNDETFVVLSDPSLAHAVMHGDFEDFEKGALYEIPRTFWHDGIITVEGEGWSEQQPMFAPMFARRRIRDVEPFLADRVIREIRGWRERPNSQPIDILAAANRLAFDVVAEGLLGIADPALAEGLFATLAELDGAESVRLNYLVKRFAAGSEGAFGASAHGEALARMDRLAGEAADERLARDPCDDWLGEIIATPAFASFAPARQRSFLAHQVATLLSAGYVTTGESIFWTLYLLAKHPAAQARAREEVLAQTGAAEGRPPMEAPPFLGAAIHESHRLYPPVWFLGRVARRPVRVGDLEIEAGARIICSPYVLHRTPRLWQDPDAYRPARFLPGAVPAVTPRSLIPYGTGRRACLGRALAQMEITAMVGMALSRFQIELVEDQPVELTGAYSMHPKQRVMFRLDPLG